MTAQSWNGAISRRCKHLAGLGKLPPPERCHPGLQAIAVLSLVADHGIQRELVPASLKPKLSVEGIGGRDTLAVDLLDRIAADIVTSSLNYNQSRPDNFYPTHWLQERNLDDLIVRSVTSTADDSGRKDLMTYAAAKARRLTEGMESLKTLHMTEVQLRDLPGFLTDWKEFNKHVLRWLLDADHDGDERRALRAKRRFEAYSYYAALGDVLREPDITAIIDDGVDLVPALRQRLGLTRAQLRSLHRAALPTASTSRNGVTYQCVVRNLLVHDVPLADWPGAGKPSQFAQWGSSPWTRNTGLGVVRNDYLGAEEIVRDAVENFQEDLLDPLLCDIISGFDGHTRKRLDLDSICRSLPERRSGSRAEYLALREFLACIRHTLVGPRGPKAFQQAAKVWHRRAAAIAALRHEHQSDRPGWPALCAPWRSPCGRFDIVPLTTAQMLVEEGNAHQHCVGSYYDACRSGRTQILSLRDHGTPAVTAEILLTDRVTGLRVGQFKGWHNNVPTDPALHEVMRRFMHDIRSGDHPLNLKELRNHQVWADKNLQQWKKCALSIDHARKAFPLYRLLFPRSTPDEFDQWCEQSGLRAGLAAVLPALLE